MALHRVFDNVVGKVAKGVGLRLVTPFLLVGD